MKWNLSTANHVLSVKNTKKNSPLCRVAARDFRAQFASNCPRTLSSEFPRKRGRNLSGELPSASSVFETPPDNNQEFSGSLPGLPRSVPGVPSLPWTLRALSLRPLNMPSPQLKCPPCAPETVIVKFFPLLGGTILWTPGGIRCGILKTHTRWKFLLTKPKGVEVQLPTN